MVLKIKHVSKQAPWGIDVAIYCWWNYFIASTNKTICEYIEYTTNPHEAFMKYNVTKQRVANAFWHFIEYNPWTPDIDADIHRRNNFLVIAIVIFSRSNSTIICNGSVTESSIGYFIVTLPW